MLKLIWKYGEEAICPACRHGNACLWESNGVYRCRDCARGWRITGERKVVGKDAVLGRNIVEAECVEVK